MMTHRFTSADARTAMVRGAALAFLGALAVAANAMPSDSVRNEADTIPWNFSVYGFYYRIPDDDDFIIAIASADRGSLHLEARYNYEDLKTASVFAGWTFSAGEAFTAEFTPMLGAAFGRTNGIVPALEMSFAYGIFDLYDESEYLIDLEGEGGSYVYSWLELGVAPGDLFRFGLTAQRVRVAETPLEVERGLFLQVTPGPAYAGVYAFNLLTDYWFLIVSVGIAW